MRLLKEALSYASTLAIGGLAYVGLNWIPIVGPLAVGILIGFLRRRGPSDGFRTGVACGVLGFLGVIYLLAATGAASLRGIATIPSFLILWILLLWNLAGIFFTGVGAALASMFYHAQDFFEHRIGYTEKTETIGGATSYVLCGNCGVGIREDSPVCPSCGLPVR